MSTCTCRGTVYIVVVQKSTGRAFTMTRSYAMLDDDIADYKTVVIRDDQTVTQRAEGWVPSGDWQRPAWTQGLDDNEFTAFWLSEPAVFG